MFLLFATSGLALLPASGSAQDDAPRTTVISPEALAELLRQEGGDNPLRVIASPDGQFGVFILSSEPRPAPEGAVTGGSHSAVGEIYHVVNGTGVFVTGGVLENPSEVESGSARYTRAGPGENGTIRDAQLVEYAPGSIFIVPPGVPHNATWEVRSRTDFLIYRFDPDNTLPLH